MRPSFSDLTEAERLDFGNGVGPGFFPAGLRKWITTTASWFFADASWRHHDFGYACKGTEADRVECDWKFFRAMLRDALSQPSILMIPPALLISTVFFLAVLLGGWVSFSYGKPYATLDEIRAHYSKDKALKNPIMSFFEYAHLPEHLQAVSKPFGELAALMDANLPNNAEKSAGLRKLLEAKDCMVRANLK